MNLRKIFFALCASLSVAVTAPASAAQIAFNFSTNTPLFGGPVTGSGIFTISDTSMQVGGRTAFDIVSITGTVNGSAITAPIGNYGDFFTTGPSFLDGTGLRFFTAAGNDIRFFYQDSVSRYRVNTFSPGSSSFVTASATRINDVPEPMTLLLFGAGLAGAAALRRRKKVA